MVKGVVTFIDAQYILFKNSFSNGLGGTGVSNGGKVFHTSAFGNLNFANIIIGKARIFIIKREKKETNKQRNKSKRKRERKGFSKYKIKEIPFTLYIF